MDDRRDWPPLEPARVGLRGRCPRCGEGRLFSGFLTLAPRCDHCGLDYSFADPADGPAFFVICFACIPSVLFAVYAEVAYEPSFWFHAFISVPLIVLTCILPLRPLKGWLVASQYYHKAEEGRLAAPGERNGSADGTR
ncbi:membrane protein [Aureimonas endophytica]|uniref:Membrane protein n=1 Tax=Aureimonas endophytica TaxID=2027858 RepID=A0A917E4J0_9HYPH|nr:DUF983 domain-containing protein [Aureimonas endophytica]GGE03621.1 membrane protein [Aureimonas endophytica]